MSYFSYVSPILTNVLLSVVSGLHKAIHWGVERKYHNSVYIYSWSHPFSFPSSKNAFILFSSLLKDAFVTCSGDVQFFSFSIWRIVLPPSELHSFRGEICLWIETFSLSLVFRNIILCLSWTNLFVFLLCKFVSASWICRFVSLSKFGKFSTVICFSSSAAWNTLCLSPPSETLWYKGWAFSIVPCVSKALFPF